MEMEVLSAFDTCAEEYDEWYRIEQGSLIFESEMKTVEVLAPKGLGIEIGVGTGVFSTRLGVFLGVDPASRMIKIAKRKGVNVVQALGELLPIKNESLDYVLFAFTICFLKDTQASLRETWRVLKYGGNLIIGFIPRKSKWGKHYLKKKADGHRFYKHANFYTLDEIEEILSREGFRIIKSSGTLHQSPEIVRKSEEPSSDLSGSGFICIKAAKTPEGKP